MPIFRSPQGIGRGEIAESRVEVPFFAAFMVLCAVSLLVVHVYTQNYSLTLALAVSMIVFGATVVRVELGVAILVIAMLLSPEIDFGSELSGKHELNVRYDDVLISVIFLGVLVKAAFEGRRTLWRPSPINAGIALYSLIAVISTLLAVRANLPAWDKRTAVFVMLKMAEFYMIFFLVGSAVRDAREMRRQLVLFFVVAMIVCGYCMTSVGSVRRLGTPFEARIGTQHPRRLPDRRHVRLGGVADAGPQAEHEVPSDSGDRRRLHPVPLYLIAGIVHCASRGGSCLSALWRERPTSWAPSSSYWSYLRFSCRPM